MRARRKGDRGADQPAPEDATTLGVEVVACEIGRQRITVTCTGR